MIPVRWRWWRRARAHAGDWDDELAASERRIARWRKAGARIGPGCLVLGASLPLEPWLIELRAGVKVAGGVTFVAHDGAAELLRDREPDAQIFGRIVVGERTLIGHGSLLLAGTTLGADCVVAAGSVLRGRYCANSVIAGNPARVVGRASLLKRLLARHPHKLATLRLSPEERREVVLRHFAADE
ncbi:MAG: hypothetical protein IT519_09395 [Burkholderiales bacterium]|nr:hypothetical protein [Burkholderiales bacterium]